MTDQEESIIINKSEDNTQKDKDIIFGETSIESEDEDDGYPD
jgi:hypothetical protein